MYIKVYKNSIKLFKDIEKNIFDLIIFIKEKRKKRKLLIIIK